MSAPLETFELFGQLPYELRRLIWDYSLDSFPARLFQVSCTNRFPYRAQPESPPIIQVCHESRAAAVSYYAAHGYQGRRDVHALSASRWFHPEKDILYFTKWQAPSSDLEHMLARLGSEYTDYCFDSVRNVAFHHGVLSSTYNTMQTLRQFYRLLPSVDTIYWLVPRCFPSVSDMAEEPKAYGTTQIPDSFAHLCYVERRDIDGPHPVHRGWREIREQLAKDIRSMAESGRIPREPEVLGIFFVRFVCSRLVGRVRSSPG
ncbi:hypothetical protein F4818DRAFT_109604 [Hypoxylon cercidicola]|nr:hypothetical protein F4818DRAFT_109604 [Hypoxylon cercidicola]